jgi:ribokinase
MSLSVAPKLCVVGSVNLDLVARARALPRPGETITGATLNRYPGGKGANQALAARRLGAEVVLCAAVGQDSAADEALALLHAEGVDLSRLHRDTAAATGVALIAVSDAGENQIVVAPGANRTLTPDRLKLAPADAVICQLETPAETVAAAAAQVKGRFVVNLAPAGPVPDSILARADLLIVNETEELYYGDRLHASPGLVCLTLGARGAKMLRAGRAVARATPPPVTVADTTGAGDCFAAAITIALLEGRSEEQALSFACVAAALKTTRPGAQPGMPTRAHVDALWRSVSR